MIFTKWAVAAQAQHKQHYQKKCRRQISALTKKNYVKQT